MAAGGTAEVATSGARLWRDGHGIDRLPMSVSVAGNPVEALVVVRAEDLAGLEDVLDAARNIVALCCPSGISWDDATERAEFFAEAEVVWSRMGGILRGDDECYEDDDARRPATGVFGA